MASMDNLHHLTDRALIRIAGDDRQQFLQGLVTQDIDAVSPECAIFTSLLTPQGKILFDFFVIEIGEDYLIDIQNAHRDALIKRLTLYKLRAKVTIEADEKHTVAYSAEELANSDTAICFRDPRLDALGWRIITTKSLAGENASYHDNRRKLGVPEFGEDFGSEEMFLLDVNADALNGVSYKKGCFVGQEVTSRMKRKGDVRKRTLLVRYEGAALKKGAAIEADGSTLGEVLSAGRGTALALIRLDRWENARAAGATLSCGDREVHLTVPAYLETD